jgi:hypothetical protein
MNVYINTVARHTYGEEDRRSDSSGYGGPIPVFGSFDQKRVPERSTVHKQKSSTAARLGFGRSLYKAPDGNRASRMIDWQQSLRNVASKESGNSISDV